MNRYELDLNKYASLARAAAAEGCVLLENKNNALPIKKGEKKLRCTAAPPLTIIRADWEAAVW